MGSAEKETLERRFGTLLQVAQLRLSANNLEMWENQQPAIPWTVLDTLASYPDDTSAIQWLLSGARAQDMLCVVMGYERLLTRVNRDEPQAMKFAKAAIESLLIGEAFRIFVLYWFNLPIDYWRTTDLAGQASQIVQASRSRQSA